VVLLFTLVEEAVFGYNGTLAELCLGEGPAAIWLVWKFLGEDVCTGGFGGTGRDES
jgi:hypothetical protein